MKHNNSSFWLGKDFYEDQMDMLGKLPNKPNNKDPMKLAGYRRAIGNFVNIVTGKDIPVRYTSSGDSYTDGTTVTISANLKDHDFDPAVGLALHEGSHIKLTDFNVLKNLTDWIQRKDATMISLAEKHETIASRWEASDYAKTYVKDLLNIVEDRRIDAWVYENAPGYQGYYNALYDRYFNATIIDKGLKSDEFTSKDWDSYMFRVCNMTNPNRRLDVLNMKELWSILDLKNIDRLQNTNQALDVAWELFIAIEECLPGMKKPKVKDEEDMSPEEIASQSKREKNGDDTAGEETVDDGSKADGDDAMKGDGGEEGGSEVPEQLDLLSENQKKQLDRAIDKQKQFQEGEVKKTTVSRKLKNQIQAMEESGVEMKDVDYQYENWSGGCINKKANVTIIRNLSIPLMDTVECGMWRSYSQSCNKTSISDGIRKGVMLGKKLKIRSEERSTKFNRLRSGRIDKRMIANAGYGAEAIFEKIESFAYNPGIIHISIDNSGSMSGEKFKNAMTTAVAIAKACDMIENMDCVISFRAGSYFGAEGYARNSGTACILIAYDSRKHGMSQIKTCFPRLIVSGATPEGLCFDAIMKDILNASRGKDAYFVNMSDGQPYYQDYGGAGARKHTRAQINKMTKEGIKVISYFIAGNYRASSTDVSNFQAMYGKEAQFIDTNKIMEVAKTMNSKFLEVD